MFTTREVSGGNLDLPEHWKSRQRRMRLPKRFRDATHTEQRRANRYFLNLDLTYTVFVRGKTVDSGGGRTIDCSSAGLRFTGERPIGVGRTIELAIRWPMTLDDGVPLNLVFSGKSVRVDDCETAIRIEGYEFRTRGHGGTPVCENHAPLRAGAAMG
jgi:hypothetical protein